MKVATEREVAADFSAYVKAAKQGPIVVTNKGKAVAVLLGSESDDDVERLLMGHSEQLQAILESARKRFRQGRGIPHDTFWQAVEAEGVKRAVKKSRPKKISKGKG